MTRLSIMIKNLAGGLMIGRLRGNILEKKPPLVLLEANAVGYEVYVPMTCFYQLPKIGQEAILFTDFIVRKDAQLLYGFNDQQERALFRELIKVNGVGPKLALSILSSMSAQQFVCAVEHEEISTLLKLPSVGKKTAERLVMEMKDRLKKQNRDLHTNPFMRNLPTTAMHATDDDTTAEAISALVTLGYKLHEASRMVRKITKSGATCEVLIRDALRATL